MEREKREWPEVVGLSGAEAEQRIKAERPELKTYVLPAGSMCTRDYRLDRVRIFVSKENGTVVGAPRCG
eukprot:tig00000237_g20457.t1